MALNIMSTHTGILYLNVPNNNNVLDISQLSDRKLDNSLYNEYQNY